MSRRLVPLFAVSAAFAASASPSAAATPKPAGPPEATVKIRVGHLHGGKAKIMGTVPVIGTLSPFVPGQKVEVSFYLNGRRLERKTAKVSKGKGGTGSFRAKIRIEEGGKYAASAKHIATAQLGADSTVRKSWRVSFPSLHEGECGDVVVGFKKAMRKLGYIANSGRCFGGKTARGVLAYRKVNGMARSFRAGPGLVKRAFSGRGAYRVRHPGAGRHVEAPLSKQVLVFANGEEPVAVYPISSGKSSTPTVTGHFHFIRQEPGYNSHGMYYSFYFYGGYAVHGYESVPDYPASHGCIRTFIADQPEIYNRIDFGESIFVF
ncbi:MAG TPA: L,D-transpeptidase [Solirubrobacterales bacterium]|nr:L,D-transpeptidase [Solirubrobacterales bacterium]